MPEVGEVKRADEIGRCRRAGKYLYGSDKYTWVRCQSCGKERWVEYRLDRKPAIKCKACAKPRAPIDTRLPIIGEIRRGYQIARGPNNSNPYIWQACNICGLCRWVSLNKGEPRSERCVPCALKAIRWLGVPQGHPAWRGGRFISGGYVFVYVEECNPYHAMVRKGGNYLPEHRLVMAKHLGRCLAKGEVVHHKNGDRRDNRICNLELTRYGKHIKDHNKGYTDGYEKGFKDGYETGTNNKLEEVLRQLKLLQWVLKERYGDVV